MAILNKIRQKTFVLILVIALALFAFILSGVFSSDVSLTGKSPNVVATVNGKDISREAFMAKVEARKNPNATNTQIMNQVYNYEVNRMVMETEYDALGLSISREQMIELLKPNLQNSPEFQNEAGVFDVAKLNTYIANLKASPNKAAYQQWVDYEASVSANGLQDTYMNLVKAGTTATLAEGALEHKLEGDKVDIKYVQIPFASIPDSTVEVSKSEITAYINKNKKKYEVEDSRNIQYVKFEEVASVDDEKVIKTELNKLLKDRKEGADSKVVKGFENISEDEIAEYVNIHSEGAVKYQDRYSFPNTIPAAIKDTITKLKIGGVYGPYKEGTSFKLSKLVDVKKQYDSLKVRHILIPFKDSLNVSSTATKTEAEAKKTADSVLSIIKSDKTKFAELVKTLSSDQGSLATDGVYDWHAEGTMVKEFNEFEISKNVGDMGVVKTQYGFHVMELMGRKSQKEAYKIATIEKKIIASLDTEDKLFREASNFELATAKKSFQDVAKETNKTVKPVNTIKALDENIPGVGNQREIVRWAFEEGREVGDVKRFNVAGGDYVIVQVTAKNEAGLMNVTDASITALPEIRKEKKAKLIKDRITATTLQEVATAEKQTIKSASAINMKNPTIAGAGREPLVVGTAFGLKEGATSKLITGENGVYMVQVTKKTPAVELDNYQSFANRLETEKANAVTARLLKALKDAAEIEDNRAKTVQ
ncbi:peptidylprolyl isomerase [Pontimicrobium sp. MEBiC01747]